MRRRSDEALTNCPTAQARFCRRFALHSVPEGHLIIAQRFNAGFGRSSEQVPKGHPIIAQRFNAGFGRSFEQVPKGRQNTNGQLGPPFGTEAPLESASSSLFAPLTTLPSPSYTGVCGIAHDPDGREKAQKAQRGEAAAKVETAEYAEYAENQAARFGIPRISRIPRFVPGLEVLRSSQRISAITMQKPLFFAPFAPFRGHPIPGWYSPPRQPAGNSCFECSCPCLPLPTPSA